jgi:hypothetical protein
VSGFYCTTIGFSSQRAIFDVTVSESSVARSSTTLAKNWIFEVMFRFASPAHFTLYALYY